MRPTFLSGIALYHLDQCFRKKSAIAYVVGNLQSSIAAEHDPFLKAFARTFQLQRIALPPDDNRHWFPSKGCQLYKDGVLFVVAQARRSKEGGILLAVWMEIISTS